MLRKILAYIAVLFLLSNNLGCGFLIGAGIGGGAGYAGYKLIKKDKKKPENVANIEDIRPYERVHEVGSKEVWKTLYGKWIDKDFVFREMDSDLQKYGYTDFCRSPIDCILSYEPYVGKKGKITGVGFSSYGQEYWKVELETGEIVYARRSEEYPSPKYIKGIYLLEDYNEAKKLIGKYIWIKKQVKSVERFEKVKVLDIKTKASNLLELFYPFYLKVQTETGEIDWLSYIPCSLENFKDFNFITEDPADLCGINKFLAKLPLKGVLIPT